MLIGVKQYAYLLIVITITFPVYIYVYNPLITPSRLLVIFLPLLLIGKLNTISRMHTENKFLFFGFLIYFLFRFLSALASDDIFLSFGYVLFEFCQFYLCFILGGILAIEGKAIKSRYVTSFILLVIVYSLAEFLFQDNILRLLVTGDSSSAISAATISFRDGVYRAQGTFEHPLSLSHFLIVSLVYILIIDSTSYVKKLSYISIVFLAVFTTDSRLGLGCLAGLTIFYYLRRPNSYTAGVRFLFILSICALSYVSITSISDGFKESEEQTKSTGTRIKQATVGISLLNENLLLGVGPYEVADKLQSYSKSLSTNKYLWKSTVDSLVLIRFLESGVIAGFCFFIIIVNIGTRLVISSFTWESKFRYSEFLGGVSISFFIFSPLYTINAFAFIVLGYLFFNRQKRDEI